MEKRRTCWGPARNRSLEVKGKQPRAKDSGNPFYEAVHRGPGGGGTSGGGTNPTGRPGSRILYGYNQEAQTIADSFSNGRGWAFATEAPGADGRFVKYQVVTGVERIAVNNGQTEGLALTVAPETDWIWIGNAAFPTRNGSADDVLRAAGSARLGDQSGTSPLHPTVRQALDRLVDTISPTVSAPGQGGTGPQVEITEDP